MKKFNKTVKEKPVFINLFNDLSKYNAIVPCGIKNKGITSMKKMGINSFGNINNIITKKFLNIFH